MDNGLAQVTTNLQLFTSLLTAAITYYNYPEIDPNLRPINVPTSSLLPEYDFIIVGAGSAGNVVANRLTEISNCTVLLLEAGGPESTISDVPLMNYNLWFTDFDWNYTTVPQQNACQSGTCLWPRGHVIGGSSTLDDMIYVRGNRADYDGWSQLGNIGWSWSEVAPYFLKSEDNRSPELAGSPYHAQGGYQTISKPNFLTPMASTIIQSGMEMGYPYVDVTGPTQLGYMISETIIRNGSKCSTGKAYLNPIRNRTNLHISMRSRVLKVLIDPQNKTATGVQFLRDGQNITVFARKEVILSAGVVNSPQLLMLSGVGPAEHLERLGIPVIQNLRVGDNLQDHVGIPLVYTSPPNTTINWQSSYNNFSAILDYAINNNGPLSSPLGVECMAFVNADPTRTSQVPDTEILYSTFVPFNINSSIWAAAPYYLSPQSKGTIRLKDANPLSQPLINPMYFSDPEDLQAAYRALQFVAQQVQTKALQEVGTQLYTPLYFKCSNYSIFTDDFMMCVIKQYSVTIYHSVGTCKMGPDSDPAAVVDPRLRVYGISNLRVVDGSIMPVIVRGNTNGPIIMIGERASDLIKQDHGVNISG